jgi:hypothetical protein
MISGKKASKRSVLRLIWLHVGSQVRGCNYGGGQNWKSSIRSSNITEAGDGNTASDRSPNQPPGGITICVGACCTTGEKEARLDLTKLR